ncbi:MAG TPA: cytochrome c oxidase assembly protein [Solirubrobacteraceae bacterium]|nr:cytochrome c oxidase assembly protein [Solirubrobacteraceae bacterium]
MSPPLIWTFSPSVIVGVGASCVAYMWAWRRARQPGMPHPPGYGRLALFAASMLTLVAALLSPVDSISDNVMFVHMIQHVLLLDIVPILFILSLTKGLLRPVTRRLTRIEERAGFIAHPAFAVFLYVGFMAFWHVPRMYDLALAHENIHKLEHLCFLIGGSLYWWHLLAPIKPRTALGGMAKIVYMAVTKFFVGMLGIILVFAPHALYPWYETHPHYWGLTVHADQSLAGSVMALEQSLIMATALVYIIIRMLGDSEKEAQRQERYDDAWASYRKQLAEHQAKQV